MTWTPRLSWTLRSCFLFFLLSWTLRSCFLFLLAVFSFSISLDSSFYWPCFLFFFPLFFSHPFSLTINDKTRFFSFLTPPPPLFCCFSFLFLLLWLGFFRRHWQQWWRRFSMIKINIFAKTNIFANCLFRPRWQQWRRRSTPSMTRRRPLILFASLSLTPPSPRWFAVLSVCVCVCVWVRVCGFRVWGLGLNFNPKPQTLNPKP